MEAVCCDIYFINKTYLLSVVQLYWNFDTQNNKRFAYLLAALSQTTSYGKCCLPWLPTCRSPFALTMKKTRRTAGNSASLKRMRFSDLLRARSSFTETLRPLIVRMWVSYHLDVSLWWDQIAPVICYNNNIISPLFNITDNYVNKNFP